VTAGEHLRTVRQRHGLTQRQLGDRARTSQAAISRIERGLVSPSVATLSRLLDLMGEELVLAAERIDYGHDRTLFARTLDRTPEERIANQASSSRGVDELRRAARS
jgi:transcriptional regulator with XRE-family HTH domain